MSDTEPRVLLTITVVATHGRGLEGVISLHPVATLNARDAREAVEAFTCAHRGAEAGLRAVTARLVQQEAAKLAVQQ